MRIDNLSAIILNVCALMLACEVYAQETVFYDGFDGNRAFLNDTGIDWCVNDTSSNQPCLSESYPHEDGNTGRDARARDGSLNKIGSGVAGFDFTKLDEDGNDLEAHAAAWSCVRDNHTGLIWEAWERENRPWLPHNNGGTFTWFFPNSNSDGGYEGVACGSFNCDTAALILAANSYGLCGAIGWRLPTVNELRTLVYHGDTRTVIDSAMFPDTLQDAYWTSSTWPDRDGYLAYAISFHTYRYQGVVERHQKGDRLLVRLVRDGR